MSSPPFRKKLRTKRKIVISLHGIRTRGTWQKDLSPIITEEGWIYYPLDYGRFSIYSYLIPFVRNRKVEWFRERYNEVTARYPGVTPSIIAHSFGTYILCKAIQKYSSLKFDKIILCGSVAPRDFDWRTVYSRNQVTAVKNDGGSNDLPAKLSRFFARGTGDAGFSGFDQKEDFIDDTIFNEFDHGSVFAYDHYLNEWIPFIDQIKPFSNGKVPSEFEEPISPYDAARWSAITYFHQYVKRVSEGILRDEIYTPDGSDLGIDVKMLVVLIPKTPGDASGAAAEGYYKTKGFRTVVVGNKVAKRTSQLGPDSFLYDIPTTINTLSFLDHRADDELVDAVTEFTRTLQKLISAPSSQVKQWIVIQQI